MIFYLILTIIFLRLYFRIKRRDNITKFGPLAAAFLTFCGVVLSIYTLIKGEEHTTYNYILMLIALGVISFIIFLEIKSNKNRYESKIYTEKDKIREKMITNPDKSVIEMKKELEK